MVASARSPGCNKEPVRTHQTCESAITSVLHTACSCGLAADNCTEHFAPILAMGQTSSYADADALSFYTPIINKS
jgi:hypothetical protein